MTEAIASNTLMYIASRDNKSPHEAISRLMPIAKREMESVGPMFPGVSVEEISKFIRGTNASRNYGPMGFEIRFTAGYGFDIEAYIESFSDDENMLVEAHLLKFKQNDMNDKGQSVFKSGKTTVEDPSNFQWKLLSQFRMEKLLKESDEKKRRYLQGQNVVATGKLNRFNESRVAKEIKTLRGMPQDVIDDKTTMVLVGHDPDDSVVRQALERNLETMHSHLFGLLVQYGERNNWEPPVEFRAENLTKHSKYIIRERCFNVDHGEFILTGRTIAHITQDKEKAQSSLKRRSANHRREYIDDFPDLKGKRIFDIVELQKENELYLVLNGDGIEPRQAAEYTIYGEFLIFSENEDKAHRLVLSDLFHYAENSVQGKPEELSDNPKALIDHIQDSKGLDYDEIHCQLNIAESTSSNVMVKLNKLLKIPMYQIKAVSPIDVMRYEAYMDQVRIL